MGDRHWLPEQDRTWASTYGPVIVAYVIVTVLTAANHQGDTIHYAEDILKARLFVDFGHLLWRPVVYLIANLVKPLTRIIVGPEPYANIVWTLLAINWLAGLVCVCLVRSLAGLFNRTKKYGADLVAGGFLLSYAFLDFSQTGSAYVPGLAFLLFGLYLLVKHSIKSRKSSNVVWLPAVMLALGVSLWAPYILAIPAILVSPLFLPGPDKRRIFRLIGQSTAAFGLTAILIFAPVALSQGISSFAELKAWISASSHNLPSQSGLPRMIVGLAKSFLDVGHYGLSLKRYFLHDPYSPVSFIHLFQFHFLKVLVFYFFLITVIIHLLQSKEGRSLFWLWALGSLPAMLFGLFWIGGAANLYFPIYPVTFLILSYVSSQSHLLTWFKSTAIILLILLAISNISATAKPVLRQEQKTSFSRMQDLLPRLTPKSRIVVVAPDSVHQFLFNFPLHPVNRERKIHWQMIYDVAGSHPIRDWRKALAADTFAAWQNGGDVWVSGRVLSPRPKAEWGWVEGSVPGVSWKEIHELFSRLDFEKAPRNSDGFLLLKRSSPNEEILRRL
ncbi:MAG: hypothetical protein WCB96_11715 [Candidatus Aminicenantales bacterium]